MPRSTREWAKRKLDESVQNIDWCGTHINAVVETYQKDHPEVSDPLKIALQALEDIQTLIARVRNSF